MSDRWVINMSKHQLTNSERSVLEKGLNFAVAPPKERAIIEEFVICTERAASELPPSLADDLRSEAVQILKTQKPPKPNISNEEQQAIKDLAKNKEILIVGADKGNATVVLDKSEYAEKMNTMLADETTYKKVNKDNTSKIKRSLIDKLAKLKNEQKITEGQYRYLRPTAEIIPRVYGSPKIHKENVPLKTNCRLYWISDLQSSTVLG